MGLVKNALRRDVLVFVTTIVVASLAAVGGPIGSAAAAVAPSIGTSQQPASATVGSSVADTATVTGTTAIAVCPATDILSFPLGDTSDSGGVLFCSYPLYPGATPTAYYCDYSSSSGDLTLDSDSGFCPSNAADGVTSPTGTVTFDLYSNATTQDSSTLLFTDTESLSGGIATSVGYPTAAAGTDYWVATYNGDSNFSSVSSSATGEPVTIGRASPSISSSQRPASATVGSSVADRATVTGTIASVVCPATDDVGFSVGDTSDSGGVLFCSYPAFAGGSPTAFYCDYRSGLGNLTLDHDGGYCPPAASASVTDPSGTVTFRLYSSATTQDSSTLLFSDTETLSSGVATSGGYTTTSATTLYWVATYNGDANNNSVVAGSGAEPVSIGLALQTITGFNPPASGVVGGDAVLSATGGGSGNPVTFGIDNATSPTGACVTSTSNPHEVVFVHVGTCVVDAFQAENNAYSAGFANKAITVGPAATSTNVSYASGVLSASVSAVAPGAGTPSGTVEFLVGGQLIGTGALSSGTTTLAYAVTAGTSQQVTATFEGTSDYSASSSQTVTVSTAAALVPERVIDPSITATLHSAKPRSRTGWWTKPVTVVFHCNANGGQLAGACPRSRTLSHSGKGQSVSQTVRTTSGGSATVHVDGINVDTTLPLIRLAGASARRLYTLTAPAARCFATDKVSGIRSCRLTERKTQSATGYRITYVAHATSNAGTTATRSLTVHITRIRLSARS
jgi:Bacterial Ig-like domain (group 3)